MPSFKKHSLSAGLLLVIVLLAGFAWVNIQSDRTGEIEAIGPEITLAENIEPDLAPEAAPLPDLLEPDNIPLDANPTEIIDLIGAPENTDSGESGPRPPTTAQSVSVQNRPQTILIDGSPVPGTNITINSAKPLIRAPIQGLTRTSPFGAVPHKADDGRTVLKSYAAPFTPTAGKSYVSLVVGGLGINQVVTRRAISELPGEVTLSFAAETPNLQMWIHQARARGHEVMIELPMESADHNPADPGATYTLMSTGPDSSNIRNLDYLMSRAEGYFAVTNYGGDRLVANEKPLKPILTHLGASGLGLLYDGSTAAPGINALGAAQGLKTITAQTLLDANIQNRSAVRAMISSLQPQGNAQIPIGMGFSYPTTLDGIKDWLQTKPENTDLAPVSYAMGQNK